MALTNAEKQRRYREKRDKDPKRREDHLTKCKAKYKCDLETGKRQRIADMTPREQRTQRKEWKNIKTAQRKREKDIIATINNAVTPPASPEGTNIPNGEHHNTKKKKRNISKCYRDNECLRRELESQKRLAHRYKMRLLRMQHKVKDTKSFDTPRTKARKLLRHWQTEKGKGTRKERRTRKSATKRTLTFQFALNEEIRSKYKQLRKGKKKTVLEIIRGKLMKKYKLVNRAVNEFRLAGGRNRQKKGTLTSRMKKQITSFYERDDISRLTSGVKETITRKGIKRQKRILTDRLDKVHERFLIETREKISYTSFSRLRPFWVVSPRESDRNTCGCKMHENMQYVVDALWKAKALSTKRLQDVVKDFACDVNDINCMYGTCEKCSDKRLLTEQDIDTIEEITYLQWQTKKESRLVKGEEKEVSVTMKETVHDTVGFLIDKFYTEMKRFKIHTFNITNQLKHYRSIRDHLQPNEVLMHIDFAENYQGKLASEIQSMHFGASKTQITLHTGVFFTHKGYQTFCTVSDCLDHNPSSIWAFLDPVLDDIIAENKQIDTIHFFSDGPSTQYRQKGNFFLFSSEMERRGLKATWNYHESGHGKGIPDGVGGTLKRTANELVLVGRDIQNAAAFVENIKSKETSIKLYKVDATDVAEKAAILTAVPLKTVPGTFKLHQLKTSRTGEIYSRNVSCICEGEHEGHTWKFAHLTDSDDVPKKGKKKQKSQTDTEVENRSQKDDIHRSMKKNVTIDGNNVTDRSGFFMKTLEQMEKCETFKELEEVCINVTDQLKERGFDSLEITTPTLVSAGAEIDEDALQIFPADVPKEYQSEMFPVKVIGDGNCLPRTGSILVHGNDEHRMEMRAKIILEATLHKSSYLSHEYLQAGVKTSSKNLAKSYAMYSDQYIPNVELDDSKIKDIYEKETLKITKDKTYMGIWQIFALASVFKMAIFSIYPQMGNQQVRTDLHRVIHPRQQGPLETKYIMWTSTRKDMNIGHWVPNHFVAVLQQDAQATIEKVKIPIKQDRNEAEVDTKPVVSESSLVECENDGQMNDISDKMTIETDTLSDRNTGDGGESKVANNITLPHSSYSEDITPSSLVGQYVLVQYDKQPFPGKVTDCDESEVYVSCMHRVGKNLEKCSFYWPLAVRDQCWYSMDDVLGIIPKPTRQGRRYFVDNDLWISAVQRLQAQI